MRTARGLLRYAAMPPPGGAISTRLPLSIPRITARGRNVLRCRRQRAPSRRVRGRRSAVNPENNRQGAPRRRGLQCRAMTARGRSRGRPTATRTAAAGVAGSSVPPDQSRGSRGARAVQGSGRAAEGLPGLKGAASGDSDTGGRAQARSAALIWEHWATPRREEMSGTEETLTLPCLHLPTAKDLVGTLLGSALGIRIGRDPLCRERHLAWIYSLMEEAGCRSALLSLMESRCAAQPCCLHSPADRHHSSS